MNMLHQVETHVTFGSSRGDEEKLERYDSIFDKRFVYFMKIFGVNVSSTKNNEFDLACF